MIWLGLDWLSNLKMTAGKLGWIAFTAGKISEYHCCLYRGSSEDDFPTHPAFSLNYTHNWI
jgi:hypothetical protein